MGCVVPGGSCVVDVLAGVAYSVNDYADLEQAVASMSQDVLVSFTDADIAWAAADPSPAARIEMHMTPQASSLYGTLLEGAHFFQPFRFSCNGQSLFLGVIYLWYGAAVLNVPILDTARDTDNSVVLYLGAWATAWQRIGAGDPGARERIDRPELRAVFCQRGALRELDPNAMPISP
jgi:hypothetical protein